MPGKRRDGTHIFGKGVGLMYERRCVACHPVSPCFLGIAHRHRAKGPVRAFEQVLCRCDTGPLLAAWQTLSGRQPVAAFAKNAVCASGPRILGRRDYGPPEELASL